MQVWFFIVVYYEFLNYEHLLIHFFLPKKTQWASLGLTWMDPVYIFAVSLSIK